ncbi:MAG: hypothetical protein M3Z09_16580 [Acidobacteriota bacterium]|nr:hypothetical protein [Acidobacteriota bacterium]
MTITLDLPPQVEQAYLAAAQARGLPLADVVREALVAAQPPAADTELNPEEWVHQFKAWTHGHAAGNLPLLSDDDISRESIYRERGL